MDTSRGAGLIGLLTQKMSYDNQRQAVLAENVANSDTPGYKTRDVAAFTFGDAMKQAQIGMAVSDPKHIIPASMSGVNAKTISSASDETLPSQNNVDLEQEMMKVSANSIDFQTVSQIYKSVMSLFRIAIKGQ